MIHIDELFRQITNELIRNSQERQHVERNRVFQPANMKNRELVEKIIEKLVLPGSRIEGYDHLRELYERARRGESCLILMEHFSNFDIPCLFYLAKQHEGGAALTDSIVAMAGTKLNEESRFVLAFTEAYTRIVIYPARILQSLEGTERYDEERARSRILNRSALREMIRMKHSAHMVLLFPAGTRYRPGKENTKRVLLEVDSYLKGFDHVVFVGIAGNTLEVSPMGEMAKDEAKTDVMVYNVGPIVTAAEFRDRARRETSEEGTSAKEAVARAVEQRFDELHGVAERLRGPILEELSQRGITPTRLNITTPE
ncbi:MAG: 1-acyl-sn-glycerol-3-phosphate acyltransferase [Spirochaetales bacterium]|nr:1-acyl-sn-glycerol-3-phosphate acyltransferase [Spirochaetales bacterium]